MAHPNDCPRHSGRTCISYSSTYSLLVSLYLLVTTVPSILYLFACPLLFLRYILTIVARIYCIFFIFPFFKEKKRLCQLYCFFFCVPFAVFEEMLGRVRERERERDASAWRGPGVGSDQRIVSEFCRF